MRARARAVVIGGGVGGCSILYWLARLGWDDVVLVERADLTSGSTFHSAGLVGQLRGSLSLTKMMMASVDLYRAIGDEVGLETGWREVGSLRLASSTERMEEISRQAGWAKTFGLPLELISAAEAQELFPPMSDRGRSRRRVSCRPTATSTPRSSRSRSPRVRGSAAPRSTTNTRVTAIHVERGRVTGVATDKGEIEAGRGRQRGRDVRAGARRARGRQRPDRADGARVPRHDARRAAARHADDARPVAARLLPAGVGRPRHGRLRARSCAVVARRHPRRLQQPAAGGGLAPLRAAAGERGAPRPRRSRRWRSCG